MGVWIMDTLGGGHDLTRKGSPRLPCCTYSIAGKEGSREVDEDTTARIQGVMTLPQMRVVATEVVASGVPGYILKPQPIGFATN